MPNNSCLQYFAKKDAIGFPIVGTLQGFNPNVSLPCANKGCDWIAIVPNPVQPAGTSSICLHPNNLRYFYRVDRGKPQQVVPNSLISSYNFPTTPTDGCWREFHKWC